MSNTISALRRKISVAGDLRSVVRTMKSVAAANIGQYESSVRSLKDYTRTVELGLSVCLRTLQREVSQDHKAQKKSRVVGAIVFGSDQGLIGQFNEIVADYAVKQLKETAVPLLHAVPHADPPHVIVWAVGERVHLLLENSGMPVKGVFNLPGSVSSIAPLVEELTEQVVSEITGKTIEGAPGELSLFYNHPLPGSSYNPVRLKLLPLNQQWRKDLIHLRWPTGNRPETIGQSDTASGMDVNPMQVLRAFIREYIFVSIFRACAESLASENASRLSAMQRAEKNIEELLATLNGTFHRSRQSEIDEELFDVVASFEILSKAGH